MSPVSRRVLVTGASKGIGREIAVHLGELGWEVAVHYNSDPEGADLVRRELGARSSSSYRCNLSVVEEVESLISRVEEDGPLAALVNNAGVYEPLDFLSSSDEQFWRNWQATYSINLLAPLLLSRRAGRAFAGRGGGKILNVASRVGFKGESGAATYAATKGALINLTRSLAVELSPHHIGVFGIAPGWVETAMVRDGMDDRLEGIIATLPLGRMATVRDCANAAGFLLSEQSSYLSGQVIDINGASYFH